MADEQKATTASKPHARHEAAAPTVHHDHDRVAMLSLRSDGSPDQTDHVETLLDEDVFKAATEQQYVEQAVSAHDTHHFLTHVPVGMTIVGDDGHTEEARSSGDPVLDERVAEHERVAEAARNAAGGVLK